MPKASSQSLSEMTAKRRTVVATLVHAGKKQDEIIAAIRTDSAIKNPRTKKPYSNKTVKDDIRLINKPVSEMIGSYTFVKPLWASRILLNVDSVYRDYVFLDALRRGAAPGYEIGGLFCLPIAQTIASYAFGTGISASLIETATSGKGKSVHEDGLPTKNLKAANGKPVNLKPVNSSPSPLQPINKPRPRPDPNAGDPVSYTNAQLRLMMNRMQGFFQAVIVDMYCLGNQYVIVNPDCTFSVISPETVTVEYSASDYRRPIRYIIRTKMERAVVEDVYTAEKRTLTIKYYDDRGTVVQEYENLIGRIPIVHLVCDRSSNEIYGRAVYEAAIPLMQRYDDLIYNTVEGVKLLGNPIPVFEGLDNPTETKQLNSVSRTFIDENGNQQTEWITSFNRNAGLYIGKGGSAKMLAPPVGFTKDTLDTLRQLFLLLLNHTRIPEFLWGGAIAASKASTDSQLPPFIQYIRFRRLQLEGEGADPALGIEARGGLSELLDIWLRMYKLLNPAIVVGPVRVDWPEIDIQSDEIKFKWGTYLDSTGKLAPEDTISLAGYWDDPAAVAARGSGKQRRPVTYDEYDAQLNKARLRAAQASQDNPLGDEPPYFDTDYTSQINQKDSDGHPISTPDYNIAGSLYWQGIGGRQNS